MSRTDDLLALVDKLRRISGDSNRTVRTDTEKLRIIDRLITDWTAGKYKDCLNENLEK